MSEVRVNNIVDYGGKGAPTFDNGAVISGVSSLGSQAKIVSNVTITSGGINVSGVTLLLHCLVISLVMLIVDL